MALALTGRASWTQRSYDRLAREAYLRNAVAFRCVRMIADGVGSLPLLLYEGERELDAHDFLTLLARPNPGQSGVEFMEALAASLALSGNGYVEAVSAGEALRELHVLRPERMRIHSGPGGWPDAYDYTVGGQTIRYPIGPDGDCSILHLRAHHPFDDHYGLSPLEPAAQAIDIHNSGAEWTKALLDNAARPSGALVFEGAEGNVSDEQFARLKAELQENYQGAKNAGRPLLLEGGLKWTAMGLTPTDMDHREARSAAAREIALAFGVPPLLLGLPGDNTFANYREANLAFWRQTVLPLAGKIAAALGAWAGRRFGEGLRLGHDLDAVPALAPEREALWARVSAAPFLSDDEKRLALGYGASEDGR
ncbi:MAG: phage portal protein [Alphaproteobacteria bacterium]|nr:phage portal protein [Alphaproteobacteria bacterium]